MPTITEFIEQEHLDARVDPATSNPNIVDREWPPGTRHWRVTILTGEDRRWRTMVVPFSTGPAIDQPPTLRDALRCIVQDYHLVDDGDDFGLEPAEAAKLRERAEEQAERLRALLGTPAFTVLVTDVEVEG